MASASARDCRAASELCRQADRRGLPILGICRGAQVLNVARDGTLLQHLPDRGGSLEHRQSEPGDCTTHEVQVAPDSALAQTTGGGPVRVNSFHHQAVDRLGVGLRAVVWAPDGMVEAIEDPARADGRLVLGVQWHAETLTDQAEQLALFGRLGEAGAQRLTKADTSEQEAERSGAHSPVPGVSARRDPVRVRRLRGYVSTIDLLLRCEASRSRRSCGGTCACSRASARSRCGSWTRRAPSPTRPR